jgi:UDP-N-acetylmuramate dehydrogenase
MNEHWQKTLCQQLAGDCLPNEPLAALSTWKVGGCAELLVRPRHEQDLSLLANVIRDHELPWWVLGGGSNVLISERGVAGVVIQMSGFDAITPLAENRLRVGAGCTLARLVRYGVEHGQQGLEALAGIPGSVGGAIVGNAGAGGQEVGERVVDVSVWTPSQGGGLQRWSRLECGFSYRHSALNSDHVVVAVTLELLPADAAELRQRMEQALAHRRQAHAVGGPNAGSVFKNPPAGQAWKLIDQCGLRGMKVGNAQVSPQHANFIINTGGATAEEIYQLIHDVQRTVAQQTGVVLEPEVRMVGSFGEEHEI